MITVYKSFVMAGSGIYIKQSRYINNRAAAKNSLIEWTDYFSVQCYSNSTSGDRAYFRFPNGRRVYSSYYYGYYLSQLNYTGVKISQSSFRRRIYGIFTCEVPDSQGIMVETSIGIYHSTPSEFLKHFYIILIYSFSFIRCTICVQHYIQ